LDISQSARSAELAERIRAFMAERVYPNERRFYQEAERLGPWAVHPVVEELKPLASTMIQSEQMGAQIGPALRASSDSMRSSRRLRAEEDAQKATIKILFPLVLFVLPAMLIVIVGPAVIQIIHTLNQ